MGTLDNATIYKPHELTTASLRPCEQRLLGLQLGEVFDDSTRLDWLEASIASFARLSRLLNVFPSSGRFRKK